MDPYPTTNQHGGRSPVVQAPQQARPGVGRGAKACGEILGVDGSGNVTQGLLLDRLGRRVLLNVYQMVWNGYITGAWMVFVWFSVPF